jgi:hypothetical protein
MANKDFIQKFAAVIRVARAYKAKSVIGFIQNAFFLASSLNVLKRPQFHKHQTQTFCKLLSLVIFYTNFCGVLSDVS